jgi:hypothetical protein
MTRAVLKAKRLASHSRIPFRDRRHPPSFFYFFLGASHSQLPYVLLSSYCIHWSLLGLGLVLVEKQTRVLLSRGNMNELHE